MDEQTTQQPSNETAQAATTADDTSFADYGSDYSDTPDTEEFGDDFNSDEFDTDTDIGNFDSTDYDSSADTNELNGLQPDEIGLDSNGNIELGDKFFTNNSDSGQGKPKYYTENELRNIPFEQWDKNKLSGDVNDFYPIVQQQLQERQSRTRAQNIQNIPMPTDITEIKPYTPKELSEKAQKLACETLGLEDPDDFDSFEPEHMAAMNLAMNKLQQERNNQVMAYQRGQSEWGQLQQFNALLSQQPDFNEFNQWYSQKLKEAGVSDEQVSNGLYQYARANGNRFSLIPQIISTWYGEFQRSRGGYNRNNQYSSTNSPRRRVKQPPLLESTRGSNYEGHRRVNPQAFGEMDDDEQVAALMQMGLV